jgi:hypothetical protein
MNSRERVLTALRHEEPDRVPIELDGMASTVCCFMPPPNKCDSTFGNHSGSGLPVVVAYSARYTISRPTCRQKTS